MNDRLLGDLRLYDDKPSEFATDTGGLHDGRVTSLVVEVTAQRVTIVVADLYSNWKGLPEYPGKAEATLVFDNAARVSFDDVTLGEGHSIYELNVVRGGTQWQATLSFVPAGKLRMTFEGFRLTSGVASENAH
jgi:hypothetical protein